MHDKIVDGAEFKPQFKLSFLLFIVTHYSILDYPEFQSTNIHQ